MDTDNSLFSIFHVFIKKRTRSWLLRLSMCLNIKKNNTIQLENKLLKTNEE